MSCCSCGTNGKDAEEKLYGVLDTAGLREIAQQTHDACRVMDESIRNLGKADRATALGYGDDIVQLHRRAGERANRFCRRQFSSLIEAIDDRVSRDDWSDLVASARHEYEVRQGREVIEDVRAEFRAKLLDLDSLPSASTPRVVAVLDESLDRVASDGLNGGIQLLRDNIDYALSALAAPEMGRQPASPDTTAWQICVAGTLAIMAIALIICFAAFGCWCCVVFFIMLAVAVNLAFCSELEKY